MPSALSKDARPTRRKTEASRIFGLCETHHSGAEMTDANRGSAVKTWTFALGVAVALLALVDFVALQGEQVAFVTARLSASVPETIEISRVGQEHLVEISTRRRTHGEEKGRAIRYRLEAPSGAVVYEDSEIVARKKRFFEFVPGEAGTYRFFIEENMDLLGSTTDSARIAVYINDRRVLARLFDF